MLNTDEILKDFLERIPKDGFIYEQLEGEIIRSEYPKFGTENLQGKVAELLEFKINSKGLKVKVVRYPFLVLTDDTILNPPIALYEEGSPLPTVTIDVITGPHDSFYAGYTKNCLYIDSDIKEHWVLAEGDRLFEAHDSAHEYSNMFSSSGKHSSKNIDLTIYADEIFG